MGEPNVFQVTALNSPCFSGTNTRRPSIGLDCFKPVKCYSAYSEHSLSLMSYGLANHRICACATQTRIENCSYTSDVKQSVVGKAIDHQPKALLKRGEAL